MPDLRIVNPGAKIKVAAHINNVNGYDKRLKDWMR